MVRAKVLNRSNHLGELQSTIRPPDRHSNVKGSQVQSHRHNEMQSNLVIPFQSLAIVTATSQISALVFCLAWSIKFNFYESTATHCRVDNYLPSLSATLDFTPQRDVWRACIGLSGLPRYFIAYLYYEIIFKSKFLLFLHWLEVTALMGLSIVDSIRYFGVFLLTTIIHMGLVCCNFVGSTRSDLTIKTKKKLIESKIVKKRIALINFFAIVTALYLYDRHNRYCEPGVYSMFSLLEYIVIVVNIVYHLQAYYDLGDYSITIVRSSTSSNGALVNKSAKSTRIEDKKSQ